jgi:cell division protease FtsH
VVAIRAIVFCCVFGALAGGALEARAGAYDPDATEISYSDLLNRAAAHGVASVTIRGDLAYGALAGGQSFRAYLPVDDASAADRLMSFGVKVAAEPDESGPTINFVLNLIAALAAVVLLAAFGSGAASRGGADFAAFRRSRMRESQGLARVTFEDVAGVDEARQELGEIVAFLKTPTAFESMGARMPRGVLLAGPPGTGKTLLARAIAGEAGVPFFSVAGSDFVEMFAGVGAARVRDTFARARDAAPAILFIDEIDAIGSRRRSGLGAQNGEREQTLNQLLVEMDGFEGAKGVLVIAATNRAEMLDPALLRPGRFDRVITVPVPDAGGRERILAVHLGKIACSEAIDLAALARGTAGMSGAELANLVNEAALLAARRNLPAVGMAELDWARDKVMMGAPRRLATSIEERRRTAYHEAGHALVALALKENGRLHKVTIAPRGRALGLTLLVPEGDRRTATKQALEARIAMLLGGRVAEELLGGKSGVTTGAMNDIGEATSLARRMVVEFGLSDRLGPLSFVDADPSKETAALIDDEIRHLVEAGERTARAVLTAQIGALHRAGEALLENEELSGEAFAAYAASTVH